MPPKSRFVALKQCLLIWKLSILVSQHGLLFSSIYMPLKLRLCVKTKCYVCIYVCIYELYVRMYVCVHMCVKCTCLYRFEGYAVTAHLQKPKSKLKNQKERIKITKLSPTYTHLPKIKMMIIMKITKLSTTSRFAVSRRSLPKTALTD